MVNKSNLKPIRTTEEAREKGRKGGQASGKKRREQKTYKEMAKAMLAAKIENDEMKEIAAQFGIKELDVKTMTLLGIIRAATEGSYNAFDRLMDLVGEAEAPTDESKKQIELLNAIEKAVRDAD